MICDDTVDRIRIVYMYNGKYTQFFFAPLPDLLRLSQDAQVPEAVVDGVDSLPRVHVVQWVLQQFAVFLYFGQFAFLLLEGLCFSSFCSR